MTQRIEEDQGRQNLLKKIHENQRQLAILRKRQLHYEMAIEGAQLGMWEYDIIHHCIRTHGKIFANLGMPEVIYGVPQSVLPLFLEEERPRLLQMFADLEAGKSPVSGEFWMRWKPDMALRRERCVYSVIKDEAGRPVKAFGIGQNITAQKIEQEKYHRTLQELLSVNPQSLCTFRLNLTQNCCTEGYGTSLYIRNMLRTDKVDALFSNIAAIIVKEESVAEFKKIFNRHSLLETYRNGCAHVRLSYQRQADNGTAIWVTTYLNMLQNPDTNDLEAVAYSVDSDREKKEEQIITSITQKEYDYIALIHVATKTITFPMLSERAGATLPVQRPEYSESLNQTLLSRIDPQETVRYQQGMSLETVQRQLEREEDYVFSYFVHDDKGKQYRKQISFRYLDDTKQEILLIRSDVTAAFQQEQEQTAKIQKALLTAERANEMKTDFLSNVSHDMRTPLNAILGYANLARQEQDIAHMRDYVGKIEQAGHTLLSLINDTLDLQKIETGAITLREEIVPCQTIIQSIITAVQPMIESKKIHFTLDNSRALMATIKVDAMRVQEICINLLSNAVKFTPDGGSVELVIECLHVDQNRIYDHIAVRDTGIGISKEFLPKIFEPFSQERTAETAYIGGSGLGLSIVRRLTALMGGRIDVKSELGKGSEFNLYIDFERVDTVEDSVREDERVTLEVLSGKKVLICEDNPMNMEIARTLLEMQGMLVVGEANGRDGVNRFAASEAAEFAAILLDLRMPVMNGYEAAEKIRSLPHPAARTIPIIAMSADAYESDVKRSMEAGMNSHIAKPIDPDKLFQELARLIENRIP